MPGLIERAHAAERRARTTLDTTVADVIAELRTALEATQAGTRVEYGVSAPGMFRDEIKPFPNLETCEHIRDHTATLYLGWTRGAEVTIHVRRASGPWEPFEVRSE